MELRSLKRLHIDHTGSKDSVIIKAPEHLPDNVVLEEFKILARINTASKAYNITEIIEAWDPAKSKSTVFIATASYAMDVDIVVEANEASIITNKPGGGVP